MTKPLTYKDAGVDTEKALELVGDIRALQRRTESRHKLFQAFGTFAAGVDLSGYKAPVVFTTCDGVGTKIRLLLQEDLIEYAGVDLVAMSVNDILPINAMPLMFLDYIGIARLDEQLIKRLIRGISDALAGCECILAGGETAEMPGLVEEGLVELSGFCVGVAEKEDLIAPDAVQDGDIIIGSPSNGFHANGWSLVRRILAEHPGLLTRGELHHILAPTRIYFPEVRALRGAGIRPHAMAHITGGGIREKFPRVLNGRGAHLSLPRWDNEPVQKVISKIALDEAIHAFNMGFGWLTVVAPGDVDRALAALPDAQEVGHIGGQGIRVEVRS